MIRNRERRVAVAARGGGGDTVRLRLVLQAAAAFGTRSGEGAASELAGETITQGENRRLAL